MENRVHSPTSAINFTRSAQPSSRASIMHNITNSPSHSSSSFQRSFISTSRSKNQVNGTSLQKSKIKALPNHEMYSLGNNLPFVTVFQAIEIERLSQEVQTQRGRIKELERQIFNAGSFEIQIKELTQRCTSYQQEIEEYKDQLSKMNKICETLYHENSSMKSNPRNNDHAYKAKLEEQVKKNKELAEEISKWSAKCRMLDENKLKQIEEIKSLMDRQRKSMLDRQLKEVQVRHHTEMSNLSCEIKRLNQVIYMKEKSINNLQDDIERNQEEITHLRGQQLKLAEYEDKIRELSREHLVLSRIVGDNNNELDEARKIEMKLSQKLKTEREVVSENQYLRNTIQERQFQALHLKQKIQKVERQLYLCREKANTCQDFMAKNQHLGAQNQKLSRLLKQRLQQIQRCTQRILQLEQKHIKSKESEDLIIQLHSRIKILEVENSKLEGTCKSRHREVEQLKTALSNAERQVTLLSKADRQNRHLAQKCRAQSERLAALQFEVENLSRENRELKQLENKLKLTQNNIESMRKQNQKLQQKLSEHQIQQSRIRQGSSSRQRQSYREDQLELIMSEYEDRLSIMREENRKLTELLRDKNEEIFRLEDQKISHITLANQFNYSKFQLKDKEEEAHKLKSQSERLQAQLTAYEQNNQQLNSKYRASVQTLTRQNDQLRDSLGKKSRQCEQLKNRMARAQSELTETQQVQRNLQKMQNNLAAYQQQNEALRQELNTLESTLMQERRNYQQLHSESTRLKNTFADRNKLTNRISQTSNYSSNPSFDVDKLITKINKLEHTIRDLKAKYMELMREVGGSSNSMSLSSMTSSAQQYS